MDRIMDRAELKTRVAQIKTLPTLPHLYQRVSTMVDDPQCTIKEVSSVIDLDPILSARILQAVDWRRTIFGGKTPTVSRAISVMGFEALRQLVATQGVWEPDPSAMADEALSALWPHAVATALAAQRIAEEIGYPEPEECYLAGLVHDIGKFVMYQLFPQRYDTLLRQAERTRNTFYQCEVDSGQASHAVMGRFLVELWDLSPKIIEAVGWHHTPQLAEMYPKIASIVHIADIFARSLGLGSGGDPFVPPLKPSGLSTVNLRSTAIESVMLDIERSFFDVADIFE